MYNAQTANKFSQFKSNLKAQFGSAIYDSYFNQLDLAEAGDDHVTLVTPTRYAANVISKRYALRMRQMWSEQVSPVERMNILAEQEVTVAASDHAAMRSRLHASAGGSRSAIAAASEIVPAAPEPQADTGGEASGEGSVFTRGMSFERFCTNETNRLARHAAMKLLDAPEPTVTMIHGAAGRGKTHLLNAVGQEWLRRNPGDKVLYLTYDELMNDVCEAFISKSIKELRTFLQNTDLLLIDDIQMLRGRKRTQEELDCLIEKLRSAGKRVLVAGALPPSELAETGISQRLANRLGGGLCVSIDRPDLELRLKVGRQFADEAAKVSGIAIPQKHIELVARRCENSVREMEGALSLIQIAAESEASIGAYLSDERVRSLVNDHLKQKKSRITPEAILDFTTDLFDVSKEELCGRSRKQPIVRARHAFCFAVRKLTDTPLKSIGAHIGRDHTTVMHSIRTAEIFAETDAVFGARISKVFEEFER